MNRSAPIKKMTGEELLSAYEVYALWVSDKFSLNPPAGRDHRRGDRLRTELLSRLAESEKDKRK